MIRAKRLTRTRRGWYHTSTAHPKVVAAVAKGGVVSCADALAWHGVWVPESALTRPHIRGNRSSNVRHPGRYCQQYGPHEPEREAVDDLATAVRHAARCLTDEEFVVVCDSILNLGLMTPSELAAEFASAPARVARLLAKVDGRADSGIETMARLRLRARRIHVDIQVAIAGVGTVDLLIGERLIIEIDGESHFGKEAGQRDRHRDRHSIVGNYVVIRLTYNDVVYLWDEAIEAILAVIRRGDHKFKRIRSHK